MLRKIDSKKALNSVFVGIGLVLSTTVWAQAGQGNTSSDTSTGSKAAKKSTDVTSQETKADHKFLLMAMQGNMAEIQMAQLALKQSKSPVVQNYAQRMIEDHTNANMQATQISTRKGLTPPTAPDAKSQTMMRGMAKMSGPRFDKAYLQSQAKDHKTMAAMYQKEARTGYDDDIKGYATATLPVVQTHLTSVQTLLDPTKGAITPGKPGSSRSRTGTGQGGSGSGTGTGTGTGTGNGGTSSGQ